MMNFANAFRRIAKIVVLVPCLLCLILAQAGQAADKTPLPPKGVLFEQNIVYGKGDGVSLHLDLARPAKLDGPTPCVVVIHGGGWTGGNKEGHIPQIFDLAKRGYVSATIQYRLAPEHVFPAQVEDVKCAIRYLRAHAEKFNIDPNHIGAVGFSAGAHLVMMLGTMDSEDGLEGKGGWPDQSSKVQAVVSFAGPTNLLADDLPEISQGIVKRFLGGELSKKQEAARLASPLTYTNSGDAPMLLFQGTKDPLVPHTQAFVMAEALSKAGVPGRVEIIIGAGHGLGGVDKDLSFEAMYRFFDRYVKVKESE